MGLSIRAYGRHRGVSDAAVRKAIAAGRITAEADGTIDPLRADAQWARNTQAVSQPAVRNVSAAASSEALPPVASGSTTFVQARTANEVLKAQHHKVRLARLRNELVDRAQALAHVFALARSERDAWLNWPARVSAVLAVELGVDPHVFHTLLEREVRRHLDELGAVQPKVDE